MFFTFGSWKTLNNLCKTEAKSWNGSHFRSVTIVMLWTFSTLSFTNSGLFQSTFISYYLREFLVYFKTRQSFSACCKVTFVASKVWIMPISKSRLDGTLKWFAADLAESFSCYLFCKFSLLISCASQLVPRVHIRLWEVTSYDLGLWFVVCTRNCFLVWNHLLGCFYSGFRFDDSDRSTYELELKCMLIF